MKGVYFDTYKQRWIAKIQRNNKVVRKGFIKEEDAINYRKGLEKDMDNMNVNTTTANNVTLKEEHKTIEYRGYTQEFIEKNIITGEVNVNKFYVPATRGKVIHKDSATIVILHDGSKGVAKCGKNDTYSRKTGLKIAFNRAKIISLQKEIDRLSE